MKNSKKKKKGTEEQRRNKSYEKNKMTDINPTI